MNGENRVLPIGQMVVGQPLDPETFPETLLEFPVQILRQCGTNREHGFSPKVTVEVWTPDRNSLTLTNRELCIPHGCTKELSTLHLSLEDVKRISESLGDYLDSEGCKPPKSIQF